VSLKCALRAPGEAEIAGSNPAGATTVTPSRSGGFAALHFAIPPAKKAYGWCLSLRSQIGRTSVRIERRVKLDVCPFARPFPAGFDGCPEFESTAFVATDLSHRPLGEQVTCRNLKVGGSMTRGYYPRCGVGWPARRRGEAIISR